jgi:predicted nicotinamide N-methyase
MTAEALLAVTIVTAASMLWAMTNAGAESRLIGLHVPFIHKNARSWKAGHRTARWVIFPTTAVALVLAVLSPGGAIQLVAIGWSIWLMGLLAGGLVASIVARRAAS